LNHTQQILFFLFLHPITPIYWVTSTMKDNITWWMRVATPKKQTMCNTL
jgi:hypothetical protein